MLPAKVALPSDKMTFHVLKARAILAQGCLLPENLALNWTRKMFRLPDSHLIPGQDRYTGINKLCNA